MVPVLRQRAAPVDWHFAGPAALGLERLVQGGVLGAELSDVGPVEGLSVKGASRAVPGSRWGGPWAGGRGAEGDTLWRHLPGRARPGQAALLDRRLLVVGERWPQLAHTCGERASGREGSLNWL